MASSDPTGSSPSPPRQPSETPASRGRVLVVDDDEPEMASTLSGIVSMLGYRVQVAATGAEAPAVIPAFQPGVVLLDMDLPDTAGEVVLQRLLQSDPRLRVALLSGKRSPELARRALAQGAFGYIAKPFNRQRFGEVVQAAFAARR